MNESKEESFLEKEVGLKDVNHFLKNSHLQQVGGEFMGRVYIIIIAALSLITALAWDAVFKNIFVRIFDSSGVFVQQILYAIFLTILAAVISVYFKRKSRKKR